MPGDCGGDQGTTPQYLPRTISTCLPPSIVRASASERPRSHVVAEESNEGRIRVVPHFPDRIDQDERRYTA